MGWLDGWDFRIPIAVDNTGSAATVDVVAPIPEDLDHFWDEIDSSGDEIRVTSADGITPQTYQWSGFNKTNKTGDIEIDNLTADSSNATTILVWLYYGNTGAASTASSFTAATSAVDGHIHSGKPAQYIASGAPIKQGLTQPENPLQKNTTDEVLVWIEMRAMLEGRRRKSGESLLWEEVHRVQVQVLNNAGADQSSLYTADRTRFVETPNGFYVGVYVKAGTTATNYTIAPKIWTYAPESTIDAGSLGAGVYRILQPRVFLSVRDVLAP